MISILTQRALKLAVMTYVRERKRLRSGKLPKPDIYCFGYGANLNIERFKKYDMNLEAVGIARLENYALKFSLPCEYLGKGFASIESEEGKEVWGMLYKMDRPSLLLLDIMEWAVLNQYRRVKVRAKAADGKEYKAFAYRARYPRGGLAPSTEYKNAILKSSRELNFPEKYVSEIASVSSHDSFELDPGFSLMMPPIRRPLEKLLRPVYHQHDRIRERICE